MDDKSLINRIFTYGRKTGEVTNGVHIGALVQISNNSSFWNGRKVERWYYLKKWYVTDLEGNKATLGKDETGKYSIATPISTNYLTVIKNSDEYNKEITQ